MDNRIKSEIAEYIKNVESDPLNNLVPKKKNVDLRRNLDKKVQRLDIQTQSAIIELLKESKK